MCRRERVFFGMLAFANVKAEIKEECPSPAAVKDEIRTAGKADVQAAGVVLKPRSRTPVVLKRRAPIQVSTEHRRWEPRELPPWKVRRS